ncbi:MAG: ABC transporter permease [Acidobacteriota bacterium]
MVTRLGGLPALDRKLLRDLWEMRSQALAIAAIVAAGVTMFVTYLSNFDSLQRTLDAYYERQRLADVFASLVRAPQSLEARLAAIPGVAVVETRVVAEVTLDVPGLDEPATGRLISVPGRDRPRLNDVHLQAGRWLDPARPDEVLANEIFVEAHGLALGDSVSAIVNGRRRRLTIVGVALSPEYVYAIRPGDLFPDNRRYGVFWMERRALASAFDMEGGFNDVTLRLASDARPAAVITELDRLLEPYGGRGAVPRSLQMSVWTLDNELAQLRTFGTATPLIFLSVAAFVLHVALTRALALQRNQIAALKALGYSNGQLAWHYIKWALAIASAGAAAGIAAGWWLGSELAVMYNEFFRFPELDYRLSAPVAVAAGVGSLIVAALGAQSAVRRAVAVPPAEAMRPEMPARYRPSVFETPRLRARIRHTTRMVLRSLERQPARAVLSIVGMACAGAVLIIGIGFLDSMDVLIRQQFFDAMRQDVTVALVEPRAAGVMAELGRLPGVLEVEPLRIVPARLRAGARHRTLAITGLPVGATLQRIVDRSGRAYEPSEHGLVISRMLGDVLQIAPGDLLEVEVLESWRPVRRLPVTRLVDDAAGLQAYLEIGALRRMMREGPTVSGATLAVDEAAVSVLYDRLKALPVVAGVGVREVALRNLQDTMAENMNLIIFMNVLFAGIIAFGVVYNSARVSLSERSRELASLRVLGFTRAEISMILLGELALLTLVSLPVGVALGWGLAQLLSTIFTNEVYRITFVFTGSTVAWTCLTVIGATLASGFVVRRRLDELDLVAVLKTRE